MGLIIARSLMAQLLAQHIAAVPGRPSRGDSFVFGMAAAKDLLGVAVWVAAIFGNTVHWRGIDYSVDREGRLTPLAKPKG
jgi:hypothetical protein